MHRWGNMKVCDDLVKKSCMKCGLEREIIRSRDPHFYRGGQFIAFGKTPPCEKVILAKVET